MSLFKWFKGILSDKKTSTVVVPDGNVAIAKHPDGSHSMYIGDGQRQMKDLPPLNHIYPYSEPATVTVGGVQQGDVYEDQDVIDIIKKLITPYQAVSLNSIAVLPNKFEIGYTLSGNINVTCNVTNGANINPGASTINSSGPSIFSQQAINPLQAATIAVTSHSKSTPGSVTITVTVKGVNGESSSKTLSIPWFAPIVYGQTADELIDTQAKFNTLLGINKKLQSSRQGYYDFGGGGYKHLFIPKSMSISGIGFTDIDIVTGNPLFTSAMEQKTDKTFSNGYININFYYFRSVNTIGVPTRLQVI